MRQLKNPIKGEIYYASPEAQERRHYKEKHRVTIHAAHSVRIIEEDHPDFIEVNFSPSGRCYLHMSVDPDIAVEEFES